MFETIATLGLARAAIREADLYEAQDGRIARAKIIVALPARLLLAGGVVRIVSSLAAAALGSKRSANAARVAGIWAGELALREMSGILAPVLAQPAWPRGIANAGAVGATAGGLVFITAPVAELDDDALRAVLRHELAHLSLGHVALRGAILGLFAAVAPPLVRSARPRLAPRLSSHIAETSLVVGLAAASAAVSRRAEKAADAAAIAGGSGDDLARALEVMTAHNEARALGGLRGKTRRKLMLSFPGRTILALDRGADRIFASHPPLHSRVSVAMAGSESPVVTP